MMFSVISKIIIFFKKKLVLLDTPKCWRISPWVCVSHAYVNLEKNQKYAIFVACLCVFLKLGGNLLYSLVEDSHDTSVVVLFEGCFLFLREGEHYFM